MKKIQLSIPRPCHENWDAMKPSEKGKFCASCQKTVIDFTEMNDRQIAEFFKRPPSSVCGRFQEVQLNRNIEIPRKIKLSFTAVRSQGFYFVKESTAQYNRTQ